MVFMDECRTDNNRWAGAPRPGVPMSPTAPEAEGPPVQMEPVDLSVKTPVVLQVPKYPPQRLRNPPPSGKIHQPPAMYSLVKFVGDGKYNVCKAAHVKVKEGLSVAKWKGVFYEAKIIGSSDSVKTLSDVRDKLILRHLPLTNSKGTVQAHDDGQCDREALTDSEPTHHNDDLNGHAKKTLNAEIVQQNEEKSCDEICNEIDDNFQDCDSNSTNTSEHDPFSTDEDSSYHPSSSDEMSTVQYCSEISDVTDPTLEGNSIKELSCRRPLEFNKIKKTLFEDLSVTPDCEMDGLVPQNSEPEFPIKKGKRVAKKHYCLYCQTKQTNLPRHLKRKHINEELVKEALRFKSGSKEQVQHFSRIRKEGDFKSYKCNPEDLVTVGKSNKMSDTVFIPCPHCTGLYSKKNLKNHVRLACKPDEKNKRNILGKSKVVAAKIHPTACDQLKRDIFPSMRNDEIFGLVTTDPTIILYGNMLLLKYSSSAHHNKMITQQLRHISNIFLAISKINPQIHTVEDMLDPKFYNDMVQTIHQLAGLKDGKYKSPSVANHSCTLLTHLLHFVKCESIKKNDSELRKRIDDYTYLMQHSQSALITKVAGENRTQQQRCKVEILPTTDEINKLNNLLNESIEKLCVALSKQFDIKSWKTLNELVVVQLMIFNRKRPGDVEKTRIIEYKSLKIMDKHELEKLDIPLEEKQHAANFGRYISRGKLNRPAPTLVSKQNMTAIELLLHYRHRTGIQENNEYLFADPMNRCGYIKADTALKLFCKQNNLSTVKFTATKLRKHLATATAFLPQGDQHVISDFMGHAFDIHNNIYKQRQAQTDILMMGKVLMEATGTPIAKNTSSTNSLHFHTETETINSDFTSDAENSNGIMDTDLSFSYEEKKEESVLIKDMKRKSRSKVIPKSFLRKSRKTWRTPERKVLKNVFKKHIAEKKVPTLNECQDVICENKEILSRSPCQVRSWIAAEIKRREKYGPNNSPGWSTPTKTACRKYFKSYYEKQEYPSLAELLIAKEQVVELSEKSPEIIRSHLQHDFKYLSQKK